MSTGNQHKRLSVQAEGICLVQFNFYVNFTIFGTAPDLPSTDHLPAITQNILRQAFIGALAIAGSRVTDRQTRHQPIDPRCGLHRYGNNCIALIVDVSSVGQGTWLIGKFSRYRRCLTNIFQVMHIKPIAFIPTGWHTLVIGLHLVLILICDTTLCVISVGLSELNGFPA